MNKQQNCLINKYKNQSIYFVLRSFNIFGFKEHWVLLANSKRINKGRKIVSISEKKTITTTTTYQLKRMKFCLLQLKNFKDVFIPKKYCNLVSIVYCVYNLNAAAWQTHYRMVRLGWESLIANQFFLSYKLNCILIPQIKQKRGKFLKKIFYSFST